MKIIKNKILASLTTFGIGGPAKFYCEAKSLQEIKLAVKWAINHHLPYFILGRGSNILVKDKGYRGIVIRMKNEKIKVKNSKIFVQAGVSLNKLILFSQNHGLSGLEFLAGIPGTLGGAIYQNAGTKLGNIGQLVEKVEVLGKDLQVKQLSVKDCQFDYRSSRFENTNEVIFNVCLKLKKEKKTIIKAKIEKALSLRKNQPLGKSAGSIFKNPRLAAAGYLIENANLKGKKIGGAMISPVHANWIINLGQAKAKDVLQLISLCKQEVWKQFKVRLEEEIRIIGE